MAKYKHSDALDLFYIYLNLFRYKPTKDYEGYYNNMRKALVEHYKRLRSELYHFTPRSLTRIYEIGEKIKYIESEEFREAYYKYCKLQDKKNKLWHSKEH